MVIIYKVLVRFRIGQGHDYTELNYFLDRSSAYQAAIDYVHHKGVLSSTDKVIVQEVSIGPHGARISDSNFIEC